MRIKEGLKIVGLLLLLALAVFSLIATLVGLAGCTTAMGNDKTGDYVVMSILQGTARGSVDPNSGKGVWVRTGDSELSGVQITKDQEGYQIYFDQSKSATEWDKAAALFDMGLKAGAATIGVPIP